MKQNSKYENTVRKYKISKTDKQKLPVFAENALIQNRRRAKLFICDTCKDNHSPGPVIRENISLDFTRELNLEAESSAHSEAEIWDLARALQPLIL